MGIIGPNVGICKKNLSAFPCKTNQLIMNLKKEVGRRGMSDWRYKQEAIEKIAMIFSLGLREDFLKKATLVPMPPSKAKTDPEYDDRMLQVAIKMGSNLDVRELLGMKESVVASHARTDRPNPDELYELIEFNEACAEPEPSTIIVIDDLLTTGSHFVAAKRHLQERFPKAGIMGLFVARRMLETDDFDVIGDI